MHLVVNIVESYSPRRLWKWAGFGSRQGRSLQLNQVSSLRKLLFKAPEWAIGMQARMPNMGFTSSFGLDRKRDSRLWMRCVSRHCQLSLGANRHLHFQRVGFEVNLNTSSL